MKLSPRYGKSVEIRVPKYEKKEVPGPGQCKSSHIAR